MHNRACRVCGFRALVTCTSAWLDKAVGTTLLPAPQNITSCQVALNVLKSDPRRVVVPVL